MAGDPRQSLWRRIALSGLSAMALVLALELRLYSAQQSQRRSNAASQTTVNTPAKKNDTSPGQEVGDDEVISVRTTEVLLPVTVRDSSGRLVTNLRREDFRVIEDGHDQTLSEAALRQVPVDVALMVDASSSVATNLEDFQHAAEEFAARLGADDRISLIKFDDRVELLQDWTRSRVQLRRALKRISPGMFTRFNDALYLAAHDLFQNDSRDRRQALVVLTDGIDSGRGYATAEKALNELLHAGVSIYVISNIEIERKNKQAELDTLMGGTDASVRFNELRIGDLRQGLSVLDASEKNLEKLTAATGGRLYNPESFKLLDSVYQEVAEELRSQYALYYSPANKERDGRFRRVRVETLDRALRPTTRMGYFAPRG